MSATKFLCVNTVSNKVVRHSLAYLSVQKLYAVDTLCSVLRKVTGLRPKFEQ